MSDLGKKILASSSSEREKVEAFGHEFYIREMSEGERLWFVRENSSASKRGDIAMPHVLAQIVRLTACDENWNPLFDESDVEQLSNLSGKTMDRLAELALKLSGLEAKKDKDEEGNEIPPLSEENCGTGEPAVVSA